MAKFEITVHRTDIYEVEVDENIINDEWINSFESVMWPVDRGCPYEDLAKEIGKMRSRFGRHLFVEGIGYIPTENEYVFEHEKKILAQGFKMKVISEDKDIETDAREI